MQDFPGVEGMLKSKVPIVGPLFSQRLKSENGDVHGSSDCGCKIISLRFSSILRKCAPSSHRLGMSLESLYFLPTTIINYFSSRLWFATDNWQLQNLKRDAIFSSRLAIKLFKMSTDAEPYRKHWCKENWEVKVVESFFLPSFFSPVVKKQPGRRNFFFVRLFPRFICGC